jgi:hypothetical protein
MNAGKEEVDQKAVAPHHYIDGESSFYSDLNSHSPYTDFVDF